MGLGLSEVGDDEDDCPHGRIAGKCADAVMLPFPRDAFVHQVGNVTYRFEVLGFPTDGGRLEQKMATAEGGVTVRALVGVVTKDGNVVADAGADQAVDEGTSVTLDGSRSRVSDLTYRWEQLSGPAVVLDDPYAVRPRFRLGMYTEDQELRFRLTVRDTVEPDRYVSSDTVVVFVNDPNDPPVADAGGPYTVPEGDTVRLSGVVTDPDDNIKTISWDFHGDARFDDGTDDLTPVFSAVGLDGPSVVTIALRVCDDFGVCATDTAEVHVTNVAPTVTVRRLDDVKIWRNDVIQLVGTFTDPAGSLDDPFTFGWGDAPPRSTGTSGSTTYGSALPHTRSYALEGTYTIELAVTDKDGATGRDSVRVVVHNKPPECGTARPTIPVLWARDHGYIEVGIIGLTDAEGDPLAVTVTAIHQDEPVLGKSSGHTDVDGKGVGTSVAVLRAERDGTGDGRVYHVSYSVDDGHGGSCRGTVQVGVPHDQRGTPAVDQGPLYDSTKG